MTRLQKRLVLCGLAVTTMVGVVTLATFAPGVLIGIGLCLLGRGLWILTGEVTSCR